MLVGVGGQGGGALDAGAAFALLMASLCWASGSVVAKVIALPSSPLLATGMQLIAGGALALVTGLAAGEGARVALEKIPATAWLSWLYLVTFGSLVGFTAYSFLIRAVSPAVLSTYAYVNPVVAMALGATLGGEVLSARMLAAAGVILGGVVLMATAPAATPPRTPAVALPRARRLPRSA
jgi:drug/metabolite transporter (DMT)-like permease